MKYGITIMLIALLGAFVSIGADYTPVSEQDSFVQTASITSTASVLQTNSFTTAFSAAPVVVCTYTEDPGDVRPIFITSVTTSNFVCSITADMNFAYVAVGTAD